MPTPDYKEHTRALAWGLNLDQPDVTTPEEIAEFRRVSAAQLGVQQDGLDFWLDASPDVLKRYRLWADKLRIIEDDESPNKWSASAVAIMYVYALTGFEEGIRYSLHGLNRTMTRAQILEQMALVFRYAGPRGMFTLARAANAHEWREPSEPARWPKGWGPDPGAFKSGADFSDPGVSQDDVDKIVAWYQRWLGEVPRHVSFLAKHRPILLKAYRNRYENTLRQLPKQTEPYALLQISITRGFAGGIREGLLLARGFGVTKTQILEAIDWGTFYGGHESLNVVDEVAGDVLDSWPALVPPVLTSKICSCPGRIEEPCPRPSRYRARKNFSATRSSSSAAAVFGRPACKRSPTSSASRGRCFTTTSNPRKTCSGASSAIWATRCSSRPGPSPSRTSRPSAVSPCCSSGT